MVFLKPKTLLSVLDKATYPLLVMFFVSLGFGLYHAFFLSPPDYQQGEYVRIMYVHVPASWWGLGCYGFIGLFSLSFLISKSPLYFYMARSLSIIGMVCTLISLITGSLWGKPTWGTYWVWDARLTSMALLFFIYLGYYHLSLSEKRAYPASILSLIGVINLPIIKWSVDWWSTLHQSASVMKLSKPSMPLSMLTPLLIMAFTFLIAILLLFSWRLRTQIYNKLS